MKALRFALVAIAVLLLVVVAAGLWVTSTQSGTGWLLGTVSDRFVPALSIGETNGSLAQELEVRNLVYAPPGSDTRIEVDAATVDLGLLDLLGGTVRIESAAIEGVDAVLGESSEPQQQEAQQQGSPLEPPIDIVVDEFTLQDAVVRNAGAEEPLVEVEDARFAGSWTSSGIAVEQLSLDAEQGNVRLTGRASTGDTLAVDADGRFEWQVGDSRYAGQLEVGTSEGTTEAVVNLNAPFNASLTASADLDPLEWQVDLEIPEFDPRDALLPAGQFESIAASLSGSGTDDTARIEGRLTLDGEPIVIETLEVRQQPEATVIESLVLSLGEGSSGTLRASGSLATGADPLVADLDVRWQDLELPEAWLGRALSTRGELDLSGSPADFEVSGEIAAGPSADQLTEITLALSGSTEALEIEQLDLVQETGRFAAEGSLELGPEVAWDLTAEARSFDPGELLPSWKGDLEFDLATTGRLTDDGPQAEIKLASLDGELRGRPVAGHADLTIAPPSIAGELRLNSGESTVAIDAEPGDTLDADVSIEIASLNDWLPDAAGAISGDFHVGGTWESLDLAGEATASGIDFAGTKVDSATVTVDLAALREPSGSARLRARDLEVAGLEFASVRADVESPAADRFVIDVTAEGERLDASLGVSATRADPGWSGTIDELKLDLAEVEPLVLAGPVAFDTAPGEATLERFCLTGVARLCASVEMGPGQLLRADYELEQVPLNLVNVFAPDAMPGDLEGAVAGTGEFARSETGQLSGNAKLRSELAKLHFLPADGGADPEAGETLLLYENLEANLRLNGSQAQARVTGALGGEGSLEAEVSLAGIGEDRTRIDGTIDARLPTLEPIAPFVPQVTELGGRLEADLALAGTLDAPEVSGQLAARELAAGIPDLGLDLRNGNFEITPRSAGGFALDGSIESGDGSLAFDGAIAFDGPTQVSITGEQFLAADLPAGEVVITPDLELARTAERIELTGQVRIPRADIDISKLPQGRPQQASPDVVIVDAKVEDEEADAVPVPLYAEIEVILGDEVVIEGYGLRAELDGSIVVTEQPNRQTLASGTITVNGGYQAYGQDLTVTDGQLLFAGTPIDNPRLNLIAERELDEVTAGLQITGTARSPEVRVISDPAVGDADALSYLVAGRPLQEIGGAEGGDMDALQRATRSLGGAAGGVLAEAIGQRLGIDEASVEESEVLGGAAFTLGEYLSPRLYLGYGVGLFEPGEIVTLRYLLSDDWSVEAVQGPEETRTAIQYEIER